MLTLSGGFAQASVSGVVISQIYGGGGNSGTTLRNDFIEVFNAGSAPVSLAGWSVQYASTAGTSWQVTNLGAATLAPGQYYLVQQAAQGGGTQNLPTPDAIGTIPMSASGGKVALVASTTALTGSTPSGASLVDLVGWGAATYFEGAAAPSTVATTAVLRNAAGCTDSDNNGSDFTAAAPTPRNSSTALQPCGSVVAQPIVPNCPALTLLAGAAGSAQATASDVDSIVNAATIEGSLPAGFTLGNFVSATVVGGTAQLSLNVAAGTASGRYPIALRWSNDSGQTASCTLDVTIAGITPIPEIQGSASSSALNGQPVTTRGVVTLRTNNGFFLQDPTGDGNPDTSDGIFVFTSSAPTVSVGQLVQLSGTVTEFNTGAATNADTLAHPVTELTGISGITVLGSGFAVPPVEVVLPEAVNDELERYEGMLVTLRGPLTVSQNFFLGRYGQLTLSAGGRLETPTNRHRPGPDAQALADTNARARILLDDATSVQNPNPTPYLAADNTLRAGDTVASVTGVIDYGLATNNNTGFGDYKVQPTAPVAVTRENARRTTPEAVGGNLRVASVNVLNYFTTFTDGSTASGQTGQGCSLGGAVSPSNCRGANSSAEFARQRTKIVEAIAALDADVVGLMEIQNNGATAVQNLVDALNAKLGAGTYSRVADPATGTGTDAIKVAMIYRGARLAPVGGSISDTAVVHNRPPLAQLFAAPNGERFAVIVNHFKSKGCDDAAGADLDQGDGQGCYNERRTLQAQALADFVATLQSSSGSADVILIGDLNAYAQEDPIATLAAAGFVDQIGVFNSFGYSYVFDGAAGRLDHALTSTSLSDKVSGATEWHINADEPSVIDYNLEFKQPACATCGPDYYAATPYRSSDHDPVVVGLAIYRTVTGSAGRDVLVGSAGDDRVIGAEGADTLTGGSGADLFVYRSLRDAADTITDFAPGIDRIDLSLLMPAISANPDAAFADGIVRVLASPAGALLQIDVDGSGPAAARTLATLRSVSAAAIVPSRDFVLR
ncbi:ExeM/NucH family extracellular endonuclease [Variovorax sp. YR752]|uniref:ExeM/NucH family extracellular endonuclease n=1 Tax=Variovorax sp. YR752 TaxID=1884383 RepID=UPI003137CB97